MTRAFFIGSRTLSCYVNADARTGLHLSELPRACGLSACRSMHLRMGGCFRTKPDAGEIGFE